MNPARKNTPLANLLLERIRRIGPMTFADYMRECLYHPTLGYYSQPETRRFSDYYTSVDVHPVFGRLLARQFAEMWHAMGRPGEFLLVEMGAGVGRLASHILDFAETRLADFYSAVRYLAVERSPARRGQAEQTLAAHISRGRCAISAEVPGRIPAGCLFSNELVDALPVHRVRMARGTLLEIFVTEKDGALTEISSPLSTCALGEYFTAQGIQLREQQLAEASLEACDWITELGRRLERGFLLTIDYGRNAADLYSELHMRGTMLAYGGHQASEEFCAAPGEQDLTAHVNFTALENWGARAGLEKLGRVSQTEFLLALGQESEFEELYEPSATEPERLRARLLLNNLIHPEGMGERFSVLIQQKGVPGVALKGLAGLASPR